MGRDLNRGIEYGWGRPDSGGDEVTVGTITPLV
jgi:hypothetical protein